MLEASQVEQFVNDGFVRIEGAFSRRLADECVDILWRDTGCDRNDPSTWTKPVVRLGDYGQETFRLAGRGRWAPRTSLGTFPIRFPSADDPGDAGWHTDAGFYGTDQSMRLNLASRGRALLMLFLFSEINLEDAPTRIRVGSHLDIPRLLAPAGEEGMSFIELAGQFGVTERRPVVLATGHPGDVYLCHPFLVHAAQPHHGSRPRFIAQPPLHPAEPLSLDRADGNYSPVELAIRRGLSGD
jgi:Phytanoyl-CoA dioxygenase (PhyH)